MSVIDRGSTMIRAAFEIFSQASSVLVEAILAVEDDIVAPDHRLDSIQFSFQ